MKETEDGRQTGEGIEMFCMTLLNSFNMCDILDFGVLTIWKIRKRYGGETHHQDARSNYQTIKLAKF